MNKIDLLEKDVKTYQDRIAELNDIIGSLNNTISNLDKENKILKKYIEKKEIGTLEEYKKLYVCKYTPYMVSDVIYSNFFVKISSRTITETAMKENLFNDETMALRIPRKKGSNEKYSTTVVFSMFGISVLLFALSSQFSINLDISKNYFEDSIDQFKKGNVKKYTLDEIKNYGK